MKQYILEIFTGLFFACVIIMAALAVAIDVPFIYQGF